VKEKLNIPECSTASILWV